VQKNEPALSVDLTIDPGRVCPNTLPRLAYLSCRAAALAFRRSLRRVSVRCECDRLEGGNVSAPVIVQRHVVIGITAYSAYSAFDPIGS
jgi:hypothetical protein